MKAEKTQALRAAAKSQKRLNDLEARATDAGKERSAYILAAQEAGATYAEIQAATGLSTARVTQVLRKARSTTQPTT